MSTDYASPMTELVAAPRASVRLNMVAWTLLAVGALLSIGALTGEAGRVRFAFGYLWGFSFVWTIVLGSLFFVALQHVTSSIWSVVIRRVAEVLAAPMLLLAVAMIPILLFVLLPGTFPAFPWADSAAVEQDHILHAKHAYLNVPFFVIRALVFAALWVGFTRFFVNKSLKQDRGEAGPEATATMRKVAAPFMLIFAGTATFASIDWIMSLNPYWFSTIFGVYIFGGMVAASLAAITILTVWLRDSGRLGAGVVHNEHLYSLGALLFAFTCFWAYIAFSQYMLIWYANMPEEAFYIHHRLQGGWLSVSILLALARFAFPFVLLLSRRAKMNPQMLVWVSVLILAGQLLDLYWLIMPEHHQAGPALGWQEIGPVLLLVGAVVLFVSRFLSRHPAMAIGDPLLEESRRFHL